MSVLALLLLLLTGCVAHRSGDALRSVRFESRRSAETGGIVGTQSARNLRQAMEHPAPRWQSFLLPGWVEPAWLDRRLLDEDGWRLEVWYAHHGFFDARFLGWELVRPERRPGRKVRPVRAVGHVDPGRPARVVSMTWCGTGSLDTIKRRTLERIPDLPFGEPFDREAWREAVDTVGTALRDRGHAYARVTPRVLVHPARMGWEETGEPPPDSARCVTRRPEPGTTPTPMPDDLVVELLLDVEPGPVCRFGPVTVTGSRKVPTERLHAAIAITEGAGFRPRKIAETRTRLYGLGVFSVVNVTAELADPPSPVVPVRIEVEDGKPRQLDVGPGLTAEPGIQSAWAAARFKDANVARQLWKLDAEVRGGAVTSLRTVTEETAAGEPIPLAPLVSGKVTLKLPNLFVDRLTLAHEGATDLDMENDERFFEASYLPSVSWEVTRQLTPTVGYRLQYRDTLGEFGGAETDPGADQSRRDPFPDTYLLSMLTQGLTWDNRDDPLVPTRGTWWTVSLAEAGLGGDYQFLRGQGEARGYAKVREVGGRDVDLVLAGRAGGGIVLPYGASTKGVPEPERLYLGGGQNVRGWITNRLGPIDYDYTIPYADRQPVGGNLAMNGSVEARLRVWYDLWLAAFVDTGRVWAEVGDFRPGGLAWTVGPGVRYYTGIGPVRMDAGIVVRRDAVFAEEPRWTVHLALQEAF